MKVSRALRSASVIVLVFSLGLMTCSKSGSGVDEDDGNTPFTILDLQVKAVTDSSVILSWTATGDDGNVGTASIYDLRIFDEMIMPENWDSAVQLTGEPKPHAAGQTDTMYIKELEKDSSYYFALKAGDEAGNWSGQSNCVVATCFTDFAVTIPDPNLEAAIRTQISKSTGDIYRSDLMSMIWFDGHQKAIVNLTGIEYCNNLQSIFLGEDSIIDITPLASLTKLHYINLFHNKIVNVSALTDLVNADYLGIRNNNVSEISALSGLLNLHLLDLAFNNVSDLGPLVSNSGLASGDSVMVEGNPLSVQSIDVHIPALEARGVTVIR